MTDMDNWLWCICGHLTRGEAFSYVAPDPMRVPSPIRPAATTGAPRFVPGPDIPPPRRDKAPSLPLFQIALLQFCPSGIHSAVRTNSHSKTAPLNFVVRLGPEGTPQKHLISLFSRAAKYRHRMCHVSSVASASFWRAFYCWGAHRLAGLNVLNNPYPAVYPNGIEGMVSEGESTGSACVRGAIARPNLTAQEIRA
jgi:hypothetical protein